MKLTSTFNHNEKIPAKYTCKGEDISPELKIENIPENTKSLVLIIDDPDAPNGTWDHWVMWNIEPVNIIQENTAPCIQGKNSWGKNTNGGPCPPSGTHRYFFKLFALDCKLDLNENSNKADVEKAMEGHVLEKVELIGLFCKE